jgi:hypothetical protein
LVRRSRENADVLKISMNSLSISSTLQEKREREFPLP